MELEIKNFALIIGSMKSGTSSLAAILSQHPQIVYSRRKEPSFFSKDENYRHGATYYQRNWPDFDANTHRYALDASTGYTKNQTRKVAGRIRGYPADFKFIYILRDPVARILSQMRFQKMKRGSDVPDSTLVTW